MGLNTSAYQEYAPGKTGSADYYGDADYNRDKAAGMSDAAILSQINADPSKMGNGGVGGALYNRISAGANSGGGGSSSGSNNVSYNPSPVSSRPYAPPEVIAPPEEVFGNDDDYSYEAFLADRRAKQQAAKDLAEMYAQNSDGDLISTVNVDQTVGSNKSFDNYIVGDNNKDIGNDFSINSGKLNLVNAPFGVA
tara:strand:- start:1617 stop:2198 length:582 start_codon:yes stop_codon:yes gene_type:complete